MALTLLFGATMYASGSSYGAISVSSFRFHVGALSDDAELCSATKLTIGAGVALPAAAMCICKHLELVASGRVVRLNHADKQRRMYFDLAMCFLLPAIIMALREYVPLRHSAHC